MLPNQFARSLCFSILNLSHCTDKNWNYKDVVSPFWRIYLVTGGDGVLSYNGTHYQLKVGWMYIIPDFTKKTCQTHTYLEHYYLHLISNNKEMGNILDNFDLRYEQKASPEDYKLFERLLHINPNKSLKENNPKKYHYSDLHEPIQNSDDTLDVGSFIESQGIILQLFSRFVVSFRQDNRPHLRHETKIEKVLHFIATELDKPITLEELAGISCLSPDYFSRLFLKLFGLRPIPYINKVRIEKAQLLLILGDECIEQIASNVGIPNVSYFIRIFKSQVGITPGMYRGIHFHERNKHK